MPYYDYPWYMDFLRQCVWLVPSLLFTCVVLGAVISYGYSFWDWKKKNHFVIPLMTFAFWVLSFGSVLLYAWMITHE